MFHAVFAVCKLLESVTVSNTKELVHPKLSIFCDCITTKKIPNLNYSQAKLRKKESHWHTWRFRVAGIIVIGVHNECCNSVRLCRRYPYLGNLFSTTVQFFIKQSRLVKVKYLFVIYLAVKNHLFLLCCIVTKGQYRYIVKKVLKRAWFVFQRLAELFCKEGEWWGGCLPLAVRCLAPSLADSAVDWPRRGQTLSVCLGANRRRATKGLASAISHGYVCGTMRSLLRMYSRRAVVNAYKRDSFRAESAAGRRKADDDGRQAGWLVDGSLCPRPVFPVLSFLHCSLSLSLPAALL